MAVARRFLEHLKDHDSKLARDAKSKGASNPVRKAVGGFSNAGLVGHGPVNQVLAVGFFHQRIGVNLCSICPLALYSDVLASSMERGIVTPLLTQAYNYYRDETHSALLGRPHFGRISMEAFVKEHYCFEHRDGFCSHCSRTLLKEHNPPTAVHHYAVGHVVSGAMEITPQVGATMVDAFNSPISAIAFKKRLQQAEAAHNLERARLLGATAHVGGSTIPAKGSQLVGALGISCPPNMPSGQYLDVVERHRGLLGSISRHDQDDAIEAVAQINAEIADLNSVRGRLAKIVASPTGVRIAGAALGAAVGATVANAFGAVCGAAAAAVPSPAARAIGAQALATCAGISMPAARVWQIRRDLR